MKRLLFFNLLPIFVCLFASDWVLNNHPEHSSWIAPSVFVVANIAGYVDRAARERGFN